MAPDETHLSCDDWDELGLEPWEAWEVDLFSLEADIDSTKGWRSERARSEGRVRK